VTAAALRQRLYRQRLEDGRCVLAVEVNEADLALKLIEVGLLCAKDADDRGAIAAALVACNRCDRRGRL
jgi:hypothetical protein